MKNSKNVKNLLTAFKQKLQGIEKIFSKEIDIKEAREMINRYRAAFPGAIKSVWMGSEIIDVIKNSHEAFTGIRVYFAKHTDGTTNVILAPTFTAAGGKTDFAFFDYGDTCPPARNCDGDIGN